jgi:tetratricopeptide (TPR) repeat protein
MKEEKKDTNFLLDEINKIITRFPDQPEMFVERGILFMNEYKYKEAISDFTRAIELEDKLEDAFRYRGLCYHNINKTDKAIRDFSVSIKILEKLMSTEKTNSAKYEKTLAKTYIHRGYSYQMSGYNQEACRDFLRAYNLGSKTGFNYYRKFCRGF